MFHLRSKKTGWLQQLTWIGYLLSMIVILSSNVNSATLQELRDKLRHRINEVDTITSVYDSVTSAQWLNMAQDRIAVLAGYFPKFAAFAYVPTDCGADCGDTAFFRLPADFRAAKKALIYSQGRFYPMFANPGLSKDTGLMTFDVIWSTEDSAHFIFKLGGFQDTQTDIIYDVDSSTYRLPVDFYNLTGVMTWLEQWEPVMPNPFFLKDAGNRQYDLHYKHRDTALLYLRGNFQTGDTVRVFYQKTLQTGDTVRVEYVGIPTDMANGSIECEVPDDLEEFVVEEAMSYYFTYKNDHATARIWWQQVRMDMGVLKPGGQ